MHVRQRASSCTHNPNRRTHRHVFVCFCTRVLLLWLIRTLVMCRKLLLLSWNHLLRWSIFSLMPHKTTRVERSHQWIITYDDCCFAVVQFLKHFGTNFIWQLQFPEIMVGHQAREGGRGGMQPEAGRTLAAYLFMTGFNWNTTSVQ